LRLTVDYSNTDQIAKDRTWLRTRHDHQLVYRPRYTQHLSMGYAGRYLDLQYRLRHVSKRFIRAENTKWLEAFTVADLTVAIHHQIKWFKIRIQYSLDNLTNTRYMLLEEFPIPGRVWSISAKLTYAPGI